ncbi:hypothetical protein Ancab_022503 [Ancistrocladus abbreviatus]
MVKIITSLLLYHTSSYYYNNLIIIIFFLLYYPSSTPVTYPRKLCSSLSSSAFKDSPNIPLSLFFLPSPSYLSLSIHSSSEKCPTCSAVSVSWASLPLYLASCRSVEGVPKRLHNGRVWK